MYERGTREYPVFYFQHTARLQASVIINRITISGQIVAVFLFKPVYVASRCRDIYYRYPVRRLKLNVIYIRTLHRETLMDCCLHRYRRNLGWTKARMISGQGLSDTRSIKKRSITKNIWNIREKHGLESTVLNLEFAADV